MPESPERPSWGTRVVIGSIEHPLPYGTQVVFVQHARELMVGRVMSATHVSDIGWYYTIQVDGDDFVTGNIPDDWIKRMFDPTDINDIMLYLEGRE